MPPDETSPSGPCASWEGLFAQAIDGRLPAGDSARLQGHLAGCANCRRAYAQTKQVVALLDEHLAPTVSPALWDRIEAEIVRREEAEAAQAQPAAGAVQSGGWVDRLRRRWKAAIAAAAAAALGLAVWLAALTGGAEGTLIVVQGAGGVPPPDRETTVVITLTKGAAPAAGATFDVLHNNKKVGHGKVTNVRDDGTYDGVAWPEAGERVDTGDEVRMAR